MQQISEILPAKGVRLVGPLPASLQKITTYTAAIMARSASPQNAASFIDHLLTPEARLAFRESGFTVSN